MADKKDLDEVFEKDNSQEIAKKEEKKSKAKSKPRMEKQGEQEVFYLASHGNHRTDTIYIGMMNGQVQLKRFVQGRYIAKTDREKREMRQFFSKFGDYMVKVDRTKAQEAQNRGLEEDIRKITQGITDPELRNKLIRQLRNQK